MAFLSYSLYYCHYIPNWTTLCSKSTFMVCNSSQNNIFCISISYTVNCMWITAVTYEVTYTLMHKWTDVTKIDRFNIPAFHPPAILLRPLQGSSSQFRLPHRLWKLWVHLFWAYRFITASLTVVFGIPKASAAFRNDWPLRTASTAFSKSPALYLGFIVSCVLARTWWNMLNFSCVRI